MVEIERKIQRTVAVIIWGLYLQNVTSTYFVPFLERLTNPLLQYGSSLHHTSRATFDILDSSGKKWPCCRHSILLIKISYLCHIPFQYYGGGVNFTSHYINFILNVNFSSCKFIQYLLKLKLVKLIRGKFIQSTFIALFAIDIFSYSTDFICLIYFSQIDEQFG